MLPTHITFDHSSYQPRMPSDAIGVPTRESFAKEFTPVVATIIELIAAPDSVRLAIIEPGLRRLFDELFLLPSSDSGRDQTPGGAIRHTLRVTHSVLRWKVAQSGSGQSGFEDRLAEALIALHHEVGRVGDVVLTGTDRHGEPRSWTAYNGGIADWCERHDIVRVSIGKRSQRLRWGAAASTGALRIIPLWGHELIQVLGEERMTSIMNAMTMYNGASAHEYCPSFDAAHERDVDGCYYRPRTSDSITGEFLTALRYEIINHVNANDTCADLLCSATHLMVVLPRTIETPPNEPYLPRCGGLVLRALMRIDSSRRSPHDVCAFLDEFLALPTMPIVRSGSDATTAHSARHVIEAPFGDGGMLVKRDVAIFSLTGLFPVFVPPRLVPSTSAAIRIPLSGGQSSTLEPASLGFSRIQDHTDAPAAPSVRPIRPFTPKQLIEGMDVACMDAARMVVRTVPSAYRDGLAESVLAGKRKPRNAILFTLCAMAADWLDNRGSQGDSTDSLLQDSQGDAGAASTVSAVGILSAAGSPGSMESGDRAHAQDARCLTDHDPGPRP